MKLLASGCALAAGLLLAAGSASAQGNPSSEQMLRSLQPGPGMLGTTRGIRPVGPAPAAEPSPNVSAVSLPRSPGSTAHAPAAAARQSAPATPARQAAAPSVNLTVQFATNSAELTPAAVRTLGDLGRALSNPSLAGFRFRIEGHTDTVGSPDANKALSERRAATVVDFLVGKFNMDRAHLEPAGMGEDGLLVQTPPQTPEPRNRRVQVINLGA